MSSEQRYAGTTDAEGGTGNGSDNGDFCLETVAGSGAVGPASVMELLAF